MLIGLFDIYCLVFIVLRMFWILDPLQICDWQLFSLILWMVFSLFLIASLSTGELIFHRMEGRGPNPSPPFFCLWICSYFMSFIERMILFLHWIVLEPLFEVSWPWIIVYFWTLSSTPLFFMSVLMTLSCCLGYCSFVVNV